MTLILFFVTKSVEMDETWAFVSVMMEIETMGMDAVAHAQLNWDSPVKVIIPFSLSGGSVNSVDNCTKPITSKWSVHSFNPSTGSILIEFDRGMLTSGGILFSLCKGSFNTNSVSVAFTGTFNTESTVSYHFSPIEQGTVISNFTIIVEFSGQYLSGNEVKRLHNL